MAALVTVTDCLHRGQNVGKSLPPYTFVSPQPSLTVDVVTPPHGVLSTTQQDGDMACSLVAKELRTERS